MGGILKKFFVPSFADTAAVSGVNPDKLSFQGIVSRNIATGNICAAEHGDHAKSSGFPRYDAMNCTNVATMFISVLFL